MIKNIILGYSGERGSQVALAQAADLARAAKARIHVASVEPLRTADLAINLPADLTAEAFSSVSAETVALPDIPEEPSTVLDDLLEKCRREEVFCTFGDYHGDPAIRLLKLSRQCELLVVGRRDEPRHSSAPPLGRVARVLATRANTATLFTDREHLPWKSATLLYEPRGAGGRALSLGGQICSLLNITLNVLCVRYGETEAADAEDEARFALRAYHVEGQFASSNASSAEALRNAALVHSDPLLIIPAPLRRLFGADTELIRLASSMPNSNMLLVP